MKMSHPDSKQTVDPDGAHAAEYQSQGWVEKATKPKAEKAEAAKPKAAK